MSSLPTPPLQPLHPPATTNSSRLPIILATTLSLTFLITLLFSLTFFIYRRFSRNRTAPSEDTQTQSIPRRFSYSLLRRSTGLFSPSNRLGHGGFGSVYEATLPSGISLAVKVMDSPGSLQGEREFHNELTVCSSLHNPNTLSLLGFSSDKHRRRLLLVYELMPNRSLQDALFDKKCPELMNWKKRFDIACNVASGLSYLHHCCNPPVIHGDIKPSNILLDSEFSAKIGDFGLARLQTEDAPVEEEEEVKVTEDNGSILEESDSVLTPGLKENTAESVVIKIFDTEESPETDKVSVEGERDLVGKKKGASGRDWWWKQDNGVDGSESGRVKDYVMEWIGSEIKKERPKSEWVASPSSNSSTSAKFQPKKHKKRSDWWAFMDEERIRKKKEKARKPREWWKEEFCEELTKKKTKKKKRDLSLDVGQERKRKKSHSSRGSIDWWLDGLSGELIRNGRRDHHQNQEWTATEIPKSGGISSTPSMRGTVCYIAPEYGGGGHLSEKCDVYSFGVLLLVLISGRRPLQVMASPMSEFERANLISWAKQLARNGKLLDLVDPSMHSLDKEQALLCITIALLCLQKTPNKRPAMKEIVAVFAGEAEPPHLPFEFSPSPPSNAAVTLPRKCR